MPFSKAQFATGLAQDDAGYDTTSTLLLPNSKASLPRSVNLKPYCPMPGNQGRIASCVGWSVGYGLMTIEKAIQNDNTDTKNITENAFSALFIYNQIRGTNCNSISSLPDALELLKTKGNCLAGEFDVKAEDCYTKPENTVKEHARNNIVADYSRLFDKDTEGDAKVNMIRKLLAHKKPVAIGLKINNHFMSLKQTEYWNPNLGKEPAEGHAMVVVGYDDEAACFTLLNSWGQVWGQDGFIKIKYQDMAAYCRYAFVIYLTKNSRLSEPIDLTETDIEAPKPLVNVARTTLHPLDKTVSEQPPLSTKASENTHQQQTIKTQNNPNQTTKDVVDMSGSFDINYFTGRWTDDSGYIFDTQDVEPQSLGSNHYALKKKDWHIGDGFQMALTANIKGAYVYVVSVNPHNEVKILFPRHQAFGQQFKGMYESPLLMLDGATATLPSATKWIKIDYTGTDRICILFSIRKIKGFPNFCKKLQKWDGDFDTYLNTLLKDVMIPAADTRFLPNKVAFSTTTHSDGSIVPIIIEFHSQ